MENVNDKFAALVKELNPLSLTLRQAANGCAVGGYGHVFAVGSGLTFDAADAILEADLNVIEAEYDHAVQMGILPSGLDDVRKSAVKLLFHCHGGRIPKGHANFFLDLKTGCFPAAARQLQYMRYPADVVRVISEMLLTGLWPKL